MDKGHNDTDKISRRRFMSSFARWSVFTTLVLSGIVTIRALVPRSSKYRSLIRLGYYQTYPVGKFTFVKEHNIYVYRDHKGIRVVSAICTHLGCTIEKSDTGFVCPCHGSSYDQVGHVLSGAAMKNLPWFRAHLREGGILFVDIRSVVSPDEIVKIT